MRLLTADSLRRTRATLLERTAMGQMMNGGSMMGQTAQSTSAADQLTILPVQEGCYVWSDGTSQMPMMRLSLKAGQMLNIMIRTSTCTGWCGVRARS